MGDNTPTIALEDRRRIGLGPRWTVTIDHERGFEGGADTLDEALELVREKWAEIERARAAEAEAQAARMKR